MMSHLRVKSTAPVQFMTTGLFSVESTPPRTTSLSLPLKPETQVQVEEESVKVGLRREDAPY